jgi:hypothetical protein
MDKDAYRLGIAELYTAEVLGEGLASRWLQLATDPDQKYKLGLFLQLESEAKVRLRPMLARHGLSLVEDESTRAAGAAAAERFAQMPWKEAMKILAELALPYQRRFQALSEVAAPEDLPLVVFMANHEQSVIDMAQREAAGEGGMERKLMVMLAHPLIRSAPAPRV